MSISTVIQEDFDTYDPCHRRDLNDEDVVFFQRITEKTACNGFACDLKRTSELWIAKFIDIQSEIGFDSFRQFNLSDRVQAIQQSLRDGIVLSKDDKRWVKKLCAAIKINAVYHERG